jgi:isocitrate/isopropylmalate dehydrogenase
MKTVVALPGEGIGPEVVDATCELLLGTGLPLKILTPPQGAAAVKSHGEITPDQGGTASTRDMARAVLAAYQNA